MPKCCWKNRPRQRPLIKCWFTPLPPRATTNTRTVWQHCDSPVAPVAYLNSRMLPLSSLVLIVMTNRSRWILTNDRHGGSPQNRQMRKFPNWFPQNDQLRKNFQRHGLCYPSRHNPLLFQPQSAKLSKTLLLKAMILCSRLSPLFAKDWRAHVDPDGCGYR